MSKQSHEAPNLENLFDSIIVDDDPWFNMESNVSYECVRTKTNTNLLLDVQSIFNTRIPSILLEQEKKNEVNINENKETNDLVIYDQKPYDVERPLQNSTLSGNPMNGFLSAFMRRTRLFIHDPSLALNLIQTGVGTVGALSGALYFQVSACSKKEKIRKLLGAAYLLAAIAQGSMIEGFYNEGMQTNYYNQIKSSLKMCQGQESLEVMLANLIVAYSCQLTGRKNQWKQHTGFARTILRCSGLELNQLPVELLKTYHAVALHPQLLALPLGVQMLKSFLFQFSIDIHHFEDNFPFFSQYLQENQKSSLAALTELEPQDLVDLESSFQTPSFVILGYLLMLPSEYFRQTVTDIHCTRSRKALAVQELPGYFNLVLKAYQVSAQFLTPGVVAFIRLVNVFGVFVEMDILMAKNLLQEMVNEPLLNTYELCNILAQDYESEHWFHFTVALLSFLEMHHEYEMFHKKLNTALRIRGVKGDLLLPDSLPDIRHGILNSICEDSYCSMLWQSLHSQSVSSEAFGSF